MLTIKASGYGLGGLFSKRKDKQTLLGGAEFSDEKENAAQRDATQRSATYSTGKQHKVTRSDVTPRSAK